MDTGSEPEDRPTRTSQVVDRLLPWRQSSPEPEAAAGDWGPLHGTPCGPYSGPGTGQKLMVNSVCLG